MNRWCLCDSSITEATKPWVDLPTLVPQSAPA